MEKISTRFGFPLTSDMSVVLFMADFSIASRFIDPFKNSFSLFQSNAILSCSFLCCFFHLKWKQKKECVHAIDKIKRSARSGSGQQNIDTFGVAQLVFSVYMYSTILKYMLTVIAILGFRNSYIITGMVPYSSSTVSN